MAGLRSHTPTVAGSIPAPATILPVALFPRLCTLAVIAQLALLVFLILVSFAYRIRDALHQRGPSYVGHPAYTHWAPADLAQLRWETWNRSYQHAIVVGYNERPFSGRFVNVSPNAFRLGSGDQSWPPSKTNAAFVFGGSTTFGYGVQDSETIPSFLQQALGPDWAVYNFGVGGYCSVQERILFEDLIVRHRARPALAVFIDGFNEFGGGADWFVPYLERRWAVKRLAYRIRFALNLVPATTRPPVNVQSALTRWRDDILIEKAVAQTFSIRALFVSQPVPPDRQYDLSSLSGLVDVDLRKYPAQTLDSCHYSPQACREIAQAIANYIKKEN